LRDLLSVHGTAKRSIGGTHFTYAGADTKTRFDVGEVVVGTYWLSGMGNLAKNVLTMMSAENDEQHFR